MINTNKNVGSFHLHDERSPTYYNISRHLQALGWQRCAKANHADFSEDNLNFDENAANCLEYKHLLANLVRQNCPDIMPPTYCINDFNWPEVLSQLADDFYQNKVPSSQENSKLVWILKPALLNNGQHIKIFKTLDEITQHFLSSNRLGGEHVLQQYITNPQLLRDNRKFSIRQFVILTNFQGAFLYRHGYYNVALQPYGNDDFLDLRPHLTNEHLFGFEPNVIQIPSARFATHAPIYSQIQTILNRLISALHKHYPNAFIAKNQKNLALFGMDFMVDSHNKVWLLEANHGPCFPTTDSHPLQSYLYYDFWTAVVNSFVLPMAKGAIEAETEDSIFYKISYKQNA